MLASVDLVAVDALGLQRVLTSMVTVVGSGPGDARRSLALTSMVTVVGGGPGGARRSQALMSMITSTVASSPPLTSTVQE